MHTKTDEQQKEESKREYQREKESKKTANLLSSICFGTHLTLVAINKSLFYSFFTQKKPTTAKL